MAGACNQENQVQSLELPCIDMNVSAKVLRAFAHSKDVLAILKLSGLGISMYTIMRSQRFYY